jgi:hypothetical protein
VSNVDKDAELEESGGGRDISEQHGCELEKDIIKWHFDIDF